MRKNKKGQALVEFVIILPVLLILIFGLIDFGRIINTKSSLENITEDVVELYKSGKTYEEINKFMKENNESYSIKIKNENNKYIRFTLTSSLNIITPGLNLILKNPYVVSIDRVIYYE
ncbi:MAG: TadE/TadG family type IV pilus assembly protein [Bacilli bacterium]